MSVEYDVVRGGRLLLEAELKVIFFAGIYISLFLDSLVSCCRASQFSFFHQADCFFFTSLFLWLFSLHTLSLLHSLPLIHRVYSV